MREHREVAGSNALSKRAVLAIVATLLASPGHAQTQDRPKPPCSGAGDPALVIAGCGSFLADSSRSPSAVSEALRWRGKAHVESQNPDSAIPDLDRAISLDPRDRPAIYYRGAAYLLKGGLDQAATDFKTALSIKRNDLLSWLGLFDVYRQQSRNDLAIGAIDEAIGMHPGNGAFYVLRGHVYWDIGELGRALDDFDKASSQSDLLAEDLLTSRCILLSMIGRQAAGLAFCEDVITRWPDQAGGYFTRGIVRLHQKRAGDAVADFDRAMAIGSPFAQTSASPLFGRGVAKRMLGDGADGDADIAAAVSMDPKVGDRLKRSGISP